MHESLVLKRRNIIDKSFLSAQLNLRPRDPNAQVVHINEAKGLANGLLTFPRFYNG